MIPFIAKKRNFAKMKCCHKWAAYDIFAAKGLLAKEKHA
jgi:hypothetical protein